MSVFVLVYYGCDFLPCFIFSPCLIPEGDSGLSHFSPLDPFFHGHTTGIYLVT